MTENLKGYSGCGLLKFKKGENELVKKVSRDSNYNRRLKKQCLKQLKFKGNENVLSPKVFDYGMSDGLFYFEMEYVNAPLFFEALFDLSYNEIKYYIDLLINNLSINKARNNANQNAIFNKKIDFMKKEYHAKNPNNALFNLSIEKLKSFDWERIPNSDCHGDLTLQNILLKDGKIYLIDLLDSFYNSWMFDVSRVLQDLELGWSYRFTDLTAEQKNTILFARNVLINKISEIFGDESSDILESIYYVLLNDITRIYSYAKDQITQNFLDNALKKLINILSTEKMVVNQ